MGPGKFPFNEALLQKYLTGEPCTQEELDVIKQYFTTDVYAPVIRQVMEAEWSHLDTVQAGRTPQDENYDRFITTKLQPFLARRRKVVKMVIQSMKYAAAAAVLVLCVTIFYPFKNEKRQVAAANQWNEKFAARGQRLKLTMPDSTVVYLAPESRIWYPAAEQYMSGQRTVRLEGEAYFDVVHDTAHPFTVQTGTIRTVDVGTAFNIRAYPDERAIAVTVAEGEVQVVKMDPGRLAVSKTLIESEGIVFDKDLQQWNDVVVNTNEIGNWRKGEFEFASEPLENVVAILGRHYDMQFAWKDESLKRKKITIQFYSDSRATALDLLELTAAVRLEKKGDTIWISKKSKK
ncbi:FecR family protein [Chitinophaga barathri]|uniref:DUF4974 domain-containing protein n=1 Tax=Chitinophaga barathri TaxID=1647451 RepID=A0A3N4M936_9BACT|nr:FecR domain-containing protein [Chitinophaga barathri]RPD39928.1 DUF4974 domain-containing protein [Chitinophaga barathri]